MIKIMHHKLMYHSNYCKGVYVYGILWQKLSLVQEERLRLNELDWYNFCQTVRAQTLDSPHQRPTRKLKLNFVICHPFPSLPFPLCYDHLINVSMLKPKSFNYCGMSYHIIYLSLLASLSTHFITLSTQHYNLCI